VPLNLIRDEAQRKKVIINVVVIAIALVGVSQNDGAPSQTSAFENILIDSFVPMQRMMTNLKRGVGNMFLDYVSNIDASRENRVIRKEMDEIKEQIFTMEELQKENRRLKGLLRFGEELRVEKVLAQIVAWDANSDFKVIRVNKGSVDGVKLQATVVTSEGLVGYVQRLTDNYADILTILDSNNRVDGIIQRTRSHGIVEGLSKDRCSMKYVNRAEPIILNDVVLTSGLGNIYPKGIKIGLVSKISRESYGITQDVEVNTSVDFSKLEEVIILVAQDDNLKKVQWRVLDSQDDPHDGAGEKR